MILKPNPAFVPKVVGSCSSIEIASLKEMQSQVLCFVRALWIRSVASGGAVSCQSSGPVLTGVNPLQRHTHWVIVLAYTS